MSQILRTGQIKTPTPAAGYLVYAPCFQANTDTSVLDRSGKGNNLSLGSSQSAGEAWGTANRLASLASANKHPYLAKALLAALWKWNADRKDSLLVFARMRVTLPGVTTPFMGNANGTSEGGIKCNVTSTGGVSVNFYDKVNASSVFGTTGTVDASWGSNDRSVMLLLDGPANGYQVWADGAPLVAVGSQSLAAVTVLEPQSSSFDWILGASQAAAAGVALTLHGLHMLYAPQSAGSPARQDELAMRLHRSPHLPVSSAEWPY